MARKKPSIPPPAWLRSLHYAARVSVLLALFIGVAGLVSWTCTGVLLHSPFWREYRAAQERNAVREQVLAMRARRAELLKNIDWYSSPQGAEELIRRRGWLRSDEIGVRAQIEEPAAVAAPSVAAATAPAPKRSLGGILQLGLVVFATAFAGMGGLLLYRWRKLRERRPVGVLTPRSELRRRRRQAALHEH